MYAVRYSSRFKKDLKRCERRGLDIDCLFDVISQLQEKGDLHMKYHAHRLTGNRQGQWECHIQPDWLLVWEQNDTELTLLFLQTGTHSDLF